MRPDWDKITEEAFSSDEDHVFSVNYLRRRDELLRGADKAAKDKRKGISVKRRAGLGMAATAAALILIPAATMVALKLAPKGSGESFPDGRQNASVTDMTVPVTEIPDVTDPKIIYDDSSSERHLSKNEIYDLLRYSPENYDRVSGELVDVYGSGFLSHSVKFACDLETSFSCSQAVYLDIGWQDGGRFMQSYEKKLFYASSSGIDQYAVNVDDVYYEARVGDARIRNRGKLDPKEDYSNLPDASPALSPGLWAPELIDAAKFLTVYTNEYYIGRKCLRIRGSIRPEAAKDIGISDFWMLIDKETGVVMKLCEYDLNGGLCRMMLMRSIEFDENAEEVKGLSRDDIEHSEPLMPPEICAVIGANGHTGFVKANEIIGGGESESEGNGERINVYDTDLVTVIDEIIL